MTAPSERPPVDTAPGRMRMLSPAAQKARREYLSGWGQRMRLAYFAGVTEVHEFKRTLRLFAREGIR